MVDVILGVSGTEEPVVMRVKEDTLFDCHGAKALELEEVGLFCKAHEWHGGRPGEDQFKAMVSCGLFQSLYEPVSKFLEACGKLQVFHLTQAGEAGGHGDGVIPVTACEENLCGGNPKMLPTQG